ncbi:carboxymuconolactone decarboxylase family protein [Serratia sp. M24T3]|uniref:carboxymuconolactone decarboxylase family protein n=1 Tax=Serratia sp. M24T3 TaxID=932213 RepID=UPI00025B90BB|nr:carboxymuconolactone decarboxylase family protein [Serratia sp. M24T3]EIC84980.1 carboxymuconolactone decarboxylase [Serratia sp. M24T3]
MKNTSLKTYSSVTEITLPSLAMYTENTLAKNLWNRSGLSPRDRSLITLAVVISRNHSVEQANHIHLALDNGVKPAEISEIISHLAFYAGWGNATAAAQSVQQVFEERGIIISELPGSDIVPLPINPHAEDQRAQHVSSNFEAVSQGVVQFTTDAVFNDLWLRPDLAPRDRSLVTVCALVANGQVAQITFHLNKAMDNGLTQPQAGEALTQLAFYAGWPNVFSALPVFKQVFESR